MGASPKDAMAHQKTVPIVYSEENSSGAKKNVSFCFIIFFHLVRSIESNLQFVFVLLSGHGSYDGMYKR